jgi:sterol desaturase/sphingolipid hydroxylase (fatty acid hydroxylase superfamily)
VKQWLDLFRRTRREYYADFFITPPITLALLIISVWHGLSFLWPIQFAVGAIGWTLYEYATHRWILHRILLFRDMHALHHAHQRDYIAVHPLVTIAVYALVAAIFGIGSSAVTVGFSTAYIAYSCMHTAFHYAEIDNGHWLYRMKMRHAAHHRMEVNFGVSTSLWDRVFRTEGNLNS